MAVDSTKVLDLLARVKKQGLKMSLVDNDLSIRFPKDKTIDRHLLAELRENKDSIVVYLKGEGSTEGEPALINTASHSVVYDGLVYYPVTPVQMYWVDAGRDSEFKKTSAAHGTTLSTWHVEGTINRDIFKETIAHLLLRHESLRSTYHKIDGRYLMRVEPVTSPEYRMEYMDFSAVPNDTGILEKIERFDGHRFDLSKGPLFLVRLIQTGDEKYTITIKAHHVVLDTWSGEILIRDILVIYRDLMEGVKPRLPPLKYQLKDYLALTNEDINRNYEIQKQYWHSLYDRLPEEMIIPIAAKSVGVNGKVRKVEACPFPEVLVDRLRSLSREISASMFVILQTTFKDFLHSRTGQTDFVVGTYVFGRDYPGTEDQLGCYAKTMLIRTVFEPDETFGDRLQKVKKSNEDMKANKAYTLLDTCAAILARNKQPYRTFWKINLQYHDAHQAYIKESRSIEKLSEKLEVSIRQKDYGGPAFVAIDMHISFISAHADTLKVVVSYDGGTYDSADINAFLMEYMAHVRRVVGG